MAAAVEVLDVSKRFRLHKDKYSSLKERVIHFGKIPFEDFWALRDINVELQEGRTLGLLGHNGSGKSTLLKCIGGILQPTSGEIVVRGSLVSMLELGAGFHPELSGRDNVFLNASLLGMPRREVERRFDDIVAFAELEQFIDNQVKYYSSGMYVRLGFAIAVNLEPDVLLIDEVLAVGDEAFQQRCLDRVKQFQREGRTIIFVTHAPDYVRQICDQAIVLDHGRVYAAGAPGETIRAFRESLVREGEVDPILGAPEGLDPTAGRIARIESVDLDWPRKAVSRHVMPFEALEITVGFEVSQPIDDAVFVISVHDLKGQLVYGADTEALGQPVGALEGTGRARFFFEAVPLLDGTYVVSVGIRSRDGGVTYEWREGLAQFEVVNPGKTIGAVALPLQTAVVCDRAGERAAQ
jgi:ABC-2 type transport system ATP-binding protein